MTKDKDIEHWLSKMADDLLAIAKNDSIMIGIHAGGVWIADRLHRLMRLSGPIGELNIAFYRDDFSRIGLHPKVAPSNLPFDIDDRNIILVDDVLHTGRTIRAALNEIFDYGRPATVILAVLIERSGRELPIQADVIGNRLTLNPGEQVKITGPDPLTLEIKKPE